MAAALSSLAAPAAGSSAANGAAEAAASEEFAAAAATAADAAAAAAEAFPRSLSRIMFGTARLTQTEDAFVMLDTVWANGVTAFDCARSYGAGEAEKVLGSWLTDRSIPRESAYIATKGGAGSLWTGALDEATLDAELQESLSALNMSYVDCYMLHRDDEAVPVDTVVKYLANLVKQGLARSYGFSNWRGARILAAVEAAAAAGLPGPAAVGPQFSLARPARPVWPGTTFLTDAEEVHQYQRHGLAILCWEVLGKGLLANPSQWSDEEETAPREESVEREEEARRGDWENLTGDAFRDFRVKGAYVTQENFQRRQKAIRLASQKGESLARVAVSYVLSQGPNFFAIVGPRSVAHFLEILPKLGALPLPLTREELQSMNLD
mmetsp:Transcript_53690/g.114603  ORF Transcript_53690/g.114603 Transcript_53690/m.114603 type:complete len:380 (+) Transcript_53690:66-1205(+)